MTRREKKYRRACTIHLKMRLNSPVHLTREYFRSKSTSFDGYWCFGETMWLHQGQSYLSLSFQLETDATLAMLIEPALEFAA